MSTALKRYSVDEDLAIEEAAETKHEYFDGEIFAMVGGSYRHNQISSNVNRSLGNLLEASACTVLSGDQRIVCPTGLRTYPDVTVVCGEPCFTAGRNDEIHNPVLLVEVLSLSTEAYDRGRKFPNYRSIPSLCEYLLVSQNECRIDHCIRQEDESWKLFSCTEGELFLPSFHFHLNVANIYHRIKFTDVDERQDETLRGMSEYSQT